MGYYIDLKGISIDKYKVILKTTELIPSWKVLEEDIDKNYNTPQKLDKGIRWMLACHSKKEARNGKEHTKGPRWGF